MSSVSRPLMTLCEDGVLRPGLGLPVDFLPPLAANATTTKRYPHAIADCNASRGLTRWHRRRMEFINYVTDRPGWENVVRSTTHASSWGRVARSHWPGINEAYLCQNMFRDCIDELREKAATARLDDMTVILDAHAKVIKSDRLCNCINAEFKEQMKKLEAACAKTQTYHPGTGGQQLDLVHPSVHPLAYGLTKVLRSENVPLKSCEQYTGQGEVVLLDDKGLADHPRIFSDWEDQINVPAWGTSQWLPTEIKFAQDGSAVIDSYVNNLNPFHYSELYESLNHFVDEALPLWENALSWFHDRIRVDGNSASDEDWLMTDGDEQNEADSHSDYELDEIRGPPGAWPINLRSRFSNTGLQIIFELTNIDLTPEDPMYEGGPWHIDGALNEHICATAMYTWDEENITDSYIAFRQEVDLEEMAARAKGTPDEINSETPSDYYGVWDGGPAMQELGYVLTRKDRMIVYPNVFQQRNVRFCLRDRSKPGFRKVLVMYLVDPHIKIISTANVPPQQRAWLAEAMEVALPLPRTQEQREMRWDITTAEINYDRTEARGVRERLMRERAYLTHAMCHGLENDTYYRM